MIWDVHVRLSLLLPRYVKYKCWIVVDFKWRGRPSWRILEEFNWNGRLKYIRMPFGLHKRPYYNQSTQASWIKLTYTARQTLRLVPGTTLVPRWPGFAAPILFVWWLSWGPSIASSRLIQRWSIMPFFFFFLWVCRDVVSHWRHSC